jgi:hypothetical protein
VPQLEPPLPEPEASGQRKISYEIQKNRGLTPHRYEEATVVNEWREAINCHTYPIRYPIQYPFAKEALVEGCGWGFQAHTIAGGNDNTSKQPVRATLIHVLHHYKPFGSQRRRQGLS